MRPSFASRTSPRSRNRQLTITLNDGGLHPHRDRFGNERSNGGADIRGLQLCAAWRHGRRRRRPCPSVLRCGCGREHQEFSLPCSSWRRKSTPRNSPTAGRLARRCRNASRRWSSSIPPWNPPKQSNAWPCSARGLRRICTADEQPRLGGARTRQGHWRETTAADAGSAQKAVRDQRRAAHSQRTAARTSTGTGRAHRSRRGVAQRLDRILVPAANRSAQKTARRRRGLRARAASATRRAHAGRVHARRYGSKSDHAGRASPGTGP